MGRVNSEKNLGTYSGNLRNYHGSQKIHTPNQLSFLSVVAQDPGSRAFLTPGSGMGTKSRSGSGMNIFDHISESLETVLWVKMLKFFDADADPGIFLTLDPGWKNSDPGSGINIPDPQH
jgi:hypothetical protein